MVEKEKDIIERLRSPFYPAKPDDLCHEAADEIEALRHDLTRYMEIANEHANENERLRALVDRYKVLDELVMTGRVALGQARGEFDPTKDYPFERTHQNSDG